MLSLKFSTAKHLLSLWAADTLTADSSLEIWSRALRSSFSTLCNWCCIFWRSIFSFSKSLVDSRTWRERWEAYWFSQMRRDVPALTSITIRLQRGVEWISPVAPEPPFCSGPRFASGATSAAWSPVWQRRHGSLFGRLCAYELLKDAAFCEGSATSCRSSADLFFFSSNLTPFASSSILIFSARSDDDFLSSHNSCLGEQPQ